MTLIGLFAVVIGLGLWLGSVVFFWWVVKPIFGRGLGAGKTTDSLNSIGRFYYLLSYACGFLMLFGSLGALANPKTRANTIAFMVFTALGVAISLYAGIVVGPRSQGLRERLQSSAGTDENVVIRERFDHANRLSTFLNALVVCVLLAASLCLSATLSAAQALTAGG